MLTVTSCRVLLVFSRVWTMSLIYTLISYHSGYLVLPKSGMPRLARMRSRLLLTL